MYLEQSAGRIPFPFSEEHANYWIANWIEENHLKLEFVEQGSKTKLQ